MANKAKKLGANIKDATKETVHRVKAGAEREKRYDLGDAMTTREKGKSVVKEGAERTKAGVHRTKRKLRNST